MKHVHVPHMRTHVALDGVARAGGEAGHPRGCGVESTHCEAGKTISNFACFCVGKHSAPGIRGLARFSRLLASRDGVYSPQDDATCPLVDHGAAGGRHGYRCVVATQGDREHTILPTSEIVALARSRAPCALWARAREQGVLPRAIAGSCKRASCRPTLRPRRAMATRRRCRPWTGAACSSARAQRRATRTPARGKGRSGPCSMRSTWPGTG
jgi:hypothetical protein